MTNLFGFRTPSDEEKQRMDKVRASLSACLDEVTANLRPGSASGRYAALFKTAFEEAGMWAVKSIGFERDNS